MADEPGVNHQLPAAAYASLEVRAHVTACDLSAEHTKATERERSKHLHKNLKPVSGTPHTLALRTARLMAFYFFIYFLS
jgi:hypothetical protein